MNDWTKKMAEILDLHRRYHGLARVLDAARESLNYYCPTTTEHRMRNLVRLLPAWDAREWN